MSLRQPSQLQFKARILLCSGGMIFICFRFTVVMVFCLYYIALTIVMVLAILENIIRHFASLLLGSSAATKFP